MGRRGKGKKKRFDAPQGSLSRARQFFERGDLRAAQKEAKVAYANQPTEENRRFFEQVCFRRADHLVQRGQREEGRAILRELTQTGIHDDETRRRLPELLTRVGLIDQALSLAGGGTLTDHPVLAALAADEAVLHPAEFASAGEFRTLSGAVRAALQALERQNEAEADRAVAEIARNSPFADWRIFVRGLGAFYRGDHAEAQRNWSRLTPGRAPARIVQALESLGDERPAANHHEPSWEALDRSLGQQPVLGPLNRMVQLTSEGRWDEALTVLRSARGALRHFDPGLERRVAAVFYNRLIFEGNQAALQKLARTIDPPAIDSWWHRAWAITWEHALTFHPDEIEKYWLRYEKDLPNIASLQEAERKLAQALIWERVGEHRRKVFEDQQAPFARPRRKLTPEHVLEAFEKCLELAPEHAFSYHALAEACVALERRDRAAEVHERLAARFPQEYEALTWLITHYTLRDNPQQAIEYCRRARELRPLDAGLKQSHAYLHAGLARQAAIEGRLDEGRRQFAAAEAVWPDIRNDFMYLARRSLFEEKAKDADASAPWLAQAKAQLPESAPLMLVLAIESRRYQFPAAHGKALAEAWKKELKKKCRSETAGAMCHVANAYLAMEVDYVVRPGHAAELKKYVKRATRVRWREEDLREVCQLLDNPQVNQTDDDWDLLEKFVRKGVRSFPKSPFFHFQVGELEMQAGPLGCDRQLARRSFAKAVEYAEGSSDPYDATIRDLAQQRLTFLGVVGEAPPFPFLDDFGFYDDDEFEDEEFYDDEGEAWADDASAADIAELAGNPMMREIIVNMASSMGVDPSEVFDYLDRGELPPLGPPYAGSSGPSRKPKRKKKKKRK